MQLVSKTSDRSFAFLLAAALATIACSGTPQHVGSTMLDMQPQRPTFAGQLDFDLLNRVRGTACAKEGGGYLSRGSTIVYWMGDTSLPTVAPAVRGVVSAAVLDAIDRSNDADTLVITRILTESKDNDEICAYVYARPVKLKKAEMTIDNPRAAPALRPEPNDSEEAP